MDVFTKSDRNSKGVGEDKSPEDVLKEFIAVDPGAKYTFDSERDAPQSEICREGECIAIQMHSKRLFEAMQAHGFFCALPVDPRRTHLECTPIHKP